MRVLILALSLIFSIPAVSNAQTTGGFRIANTVTGIELTSPNENWSVNGEKENLTFTHTSYFDGQVSLKKSWHNAATAQESYNRRKDNIISYLPDAKFLKENDQLNLSDSTPGVSMIYQNPKDSKVFREIMFIHKGQSYELVFQAKDENFKALKEDFASFLTSVKLN